jgi:hypothetical protein
MFSNRVGSVMMQATGMYLPDGFYGGVVNSKLRLGQTLVLSITSAAQSPKWTFSGI